MAPGTQTTQQIEEIEPFEASEEIAGGDVVLIDTREPHEYQEAHLEGGKLVPPGLLGDDTAPNPSEASLAALGSCLAVGIHANAVARGITVYTLEIELEGDLNITGVWGTGDLSEKPVGFTDVRAKVKFEADRPREELDALVAHARLWSPVANTFSRPVNLDVTLT